MRQRLRIPIIVLFSVIGTVLVLYLSFRNNVLHWGIAKVADKLDNQAGMVLNVGSSSFTGFSTISLNHITLKPNDGDTLFSVDSINIRFSVWTLLVGTIRIKEINGSGIRLMLSCSDSLCNYSGLLKEKKVEHSAGTKNYSLLLKRMLDKVFNLAPQRAMLKNLSFTYKTPKQERNILIPEFHSDESYVKGQLVDPIDSVSWECSGTFYQTHHSLSVSIYPLSNYHPQLPLLNELFDLSVGFDTLHIALNNYNGKRESLNAEGDFYVKDFFAFHKKISDDTVRVPSASLHFLFNAGTNSLELDSNSLATLDSITFYPYIKYVSDTAKEYALKLNTAKVNASDFFSSLPVGIFDNVRNIKAEGSLSFHLDFDLNSKNPNAVVFDASLKKEKFRLRKSGDANLFKMNDEFEQNVFEQGRFVRSFQVGPSNPYFTPLEKVSPNFINAVLTSEDGNFFYHNGFNEDAFRQSIATNFKAGKFVRGGSTISMQLIKNIFLTRKKTIARKAEEALLVWLIESNRLYSKQRMLEVYVNIIELGPGVYGIGEATSFYFNKKPSEITLPESIFLASLLPRPKWFKYSFDSLGNLKPQMADYYRVVSDFMLKKSLISQQAHDSLQPHVILSGPARELVIPTDTLLPAEEENGD